MKFIQNKMPSGNPDPSRWTSECGNFAIQRYTYSQKWNGTGRRKVWKPCKPFFGAYRLCDGKALQSPGVRNTFEQAVTVVEDFSWKGGSK